MADPALKLEFPPWLRAVLAYYFGVPLLTALFLGLNHSGSAHHLSTGASIIYWMGIALPFWFLLEATSRGFQAVLNRVSRRTPGVLATLCGSLVSMALFAAYVRAYSPITVGLLSQSGVQIDPPSTILTAELSIGTMLKFSVVPLYWIGVTFLFERIYGYPNYYGIAPDGVPSAPEHKSADETFDRDSKLGKLLPAKLGADILSLHAEDHYVKVHTSQGASLVRYRFADAVRDVKNLHGVQVHRSHWVRVKAIDPNAEFETDSRTLTLTDGRTVPVSQSYMGVLRMLDIV